MKIKIDIKPGARIKEINDPFIWFCEDVSVLWKLNGVTPTITSGCDGNHMPESLHYKGLAWDLRIWGLADPWHVAARLKINLQYKHPEFDVVFGDDFHKDHIHVEWDEKKGGK